MRLSSLLAPLLAALLVSPLVAEVLVVPCQTPDPMLPDGWSVVGKMIAWNHDGVYVQAFTEGNCRIVEEEVCTPGPGGTPICRIVKRRVCDEGTEYFPFGAAVKVVEERWVWHVRAEGAPVLFGEAFKTFPWWWVVLHHGARAEIDDQGCRLRLDTDVLGSGRRRIESFLRLFPDVP